MTSRAELRIAFGIILLVMVALGAWAYTTAGDSGGDADRWIAQHPTQYPGKPAGWKPPTVTPSSAASSSTSSYRVSGTAKWASVTYRNETGGTQQEMDVELPLTHDLGTPNHGQVFYISAQNSGGGDTVVVEILLKGESVKRSESSGEYVIATASGRY
jgi:hypothetical protein